MVLTEAEAKNRWCPFGRRLGDTIEGELYVSNNPNASRHCKCVGSDCTAWRWWEEKPTWSPALQTRTVPPMPAVDPEDGKNTEYWTDEDIQAWAEKHKPGDGEGWRWDPEDFCWFIPATPRPRRGYCGIAGKPDHE